MSRAVPAPKANVWARRKARRALRQRPVLELSGLAVGGDDLQAIGIQPGPQLGKLLQILLARVIEEPALNQRETLLEIARSESERA